MTLLTLDNSSLQSSNQLFKKIELLAPARDIDCFKAAITAGADAIYVGGKRFSARAYATNFDYEQLIWARNVTLNLNKKLYIALNTIIFDSELHYVEKELEFYESLQPDGIIIQDLVVAKILKKLNSKIPIHLSTQGSWFGVGGFELLQEYNIKRIILPRELTLKEITEVASISPFELEVFVHGAMCYSISGKCYWSISLGNRSGNRGTCAQPCRNKYKPKTNYPSSFNSQEFDYYLSPKDLRLISSLHELVNIPKITALKIEGRMKNADYVYNTVLAYKTMLESIVNNMAFSKNSENQKSHQCQHQLLNDLHNKLKQQEEVLNRVYTREYHAGFLYSLNSNDWNTKGNSSRSYVFIGQVKDRLNNGLHKINAIAEIRSGDKLIWFDTNNKMYHTVITFTQKLSNTSNISNTYNQYLVRGLPKAIKNDTALFLTGSSTKKIWNKIWQKDWEKMQLKLYWSGYEGQPLAVETVYFNKPLRLTTEKKLKLTSSKGLDEGVLQDKFTYIGEKFKISHHITKALGKNLFIEPSELKKLKRSLYNNLHLIMQSLIPSYQNSTKVIKNICDAQISSLTSNIISQPQSKSSKKVFIRVWNKYFPFNSSIFDDIIWILPLEMAISSEIPSVINPAKLGFWLPPIINQDNLRKVLNQISILDKIFPNGFSNIILCSNWEAFEISKRFTKYKIWLDWTFNVANLESAKIFLERGFMITISHEVPNNLLEKYANLDVCILLSHNPLVSISRFPQPKELNGIFTNSNGIKFWLLDVGNNITGLFKIESIQLEKIRTIAKIANNIQFDIAISAEDTSSDLEKRIFSFVSTFIQK